MNNESQGLIPHKFNAREYQIPLLYEVEKAINGESEKKFFYYIWHRRAGKDKVSIADIAPRRLIKDPCLVKYVYPTLVMGRDNLWDGIGGDGMKYMDHIPEGIRAGRPNESRMKISVENESDPNTPSIFQISGSDNPDSLRGGNPKLFIFSEWADQNPYAWDVVEPILRENGGLAAFNTTPKGDNHARALFEFAKNHPLWHVQTLTYKDTGVFTEDQYKQIVEDTIKRFEAQGRSASEAIAYCEQEYMCSFESPVIGSYYGAAMMKAEREGRIRHIVYDEGILVDTHWDLGIDDSMTIWFVQTVGNEIRLIDYYENSGEGLSHYAKVLQDKKYIYGNHTAPHDIEVREIGTGKSRKETAKSLGINFKTAKKLSIDDGINAVRTMLSRCYFDKDKTHRGIMALKNYRKDWDQKNKVFRLGPLHDWSSHGADAFRTLAVTHGSNRMYLPQSSGGVKPMYDGMPG
mgnify:CR=1 FL=1